MIWRALILFLVLAGRAAAVPVEVTSGEHDGFTRIVLNFGAQTDWAFGRTIDGYRFRPIGKIAQYDLQPIFDKIGKTRLAGVTANPQTQELDIGVACACHAIPFEFRPGIIVIDLRDGPPPKGSSFENPLPEAGSNSETADPMATPLPQAPLAAGPQYNWADRLTEGGHSAAENLALARAQGLMVQNSFAPLPSTAPDLQPLRNQLLRQLSRGATNGVVDLALPDDGPIPPKGQLPAARVALDKLGGLDSRIARTPETIKGDQGAVCIENQQLDLLNWGQASAPEDTTHDATPAEAGDDAKKADLPEPLLDVPSLLAQGMTALVGEFDAPIAGAVTAAVKIRLYLGFGSEARLLLSAFPDTAQDAPILMGLSYIVDGEADPTQAFAGQGNCATHAALWAAFSDPAITDSGSVDERATLLAFSGLPEHLRRSLGPLLIDRFLSWNDNASAASLREMIFRAKDETTAEIAVAEAKIALAKGDPAMAETHLAGAENDVSETAAEALITRVKARVAQGLAVDEATVTALEAMQSELGGSALADELAVAMIHARAASSHFSEAFAQLEGQPEQAGAVWKSLSILADDSALLLHAVPVPNTPPPGLEKETARRIATRLIDLGLPDEALGWAKIGGDETGALFGRIHLARRDGRSALAAVEGDSSDEATRLRAAAQAMIGDHAAAAQTLENLSDSAPDPELALAKDWQALSERPTSQWAKLAKSLNTPAPVADAVGAVDTFGPLARGKALADQSAATRTEIEKLLARMPNPAEN